MINVCPDFFGHVEKRLDKKEKVNMLRKPLKDISNWFEINLDVD